jgi:hypothetical protein
VNEPDDSEFERANSRLHDGLKLCRSVVDNYRAMLAGDAAPHAANDTSDFVSTTDEADEAYSAGSDSC